MPIVPALAALALAHSFDYFSFLVMLARHGLAAELNPIVVLLAQEVGIAGLTVAKVATVVFACAALVIVARTRRRFALAVLVPGVVAGLVGGFSNVMTIAIL